MSVHGTNSVSEVLYGCSSYYSTCSAERGKSYCSTPDAPLSHTPGFFRATDFHLCLIVVTAAGPKEITALAKALAHLPQRVIWKLSAKEVARAGGLATMNLTANIKVSTIIPSYTRAPILPCLP